MVEREYRRAVRTLEEALKRVRGETPRRLLREVRKQLKLGWLTPPAVAFRQLARRTRLNGIEPALLRFWYTESDDKGAWIALLRELGLSKDRVSEFLQITVRHQLRVLAEHKKRVAAQARPPRTRVARAAR